MASLASGEPSGTVEWTRVADGVRVGLGGDIDLSCRAQLAKALVAVAGAMPGDVLVDVTDARLMSSEGLSFLRLTIGLAADDHGVVTLHNPGPALRRLVDLFGLYPMLTITAD